jgi:hypothetical protein
MTDDIQKINIILKIKAFLFGWLGLF